MSTAEAEKAPARTDELPPVRFALTSQMFSEVGENDAKAAIKVWTQTIFKERGIPAEPVPRIYDGTEAVARALRSNQVDAIILTTEQYWALYREHPFANVAVNVRNGSIHEEYVLLVRQDSGIKELGDLKGKQLSLLRNPKTSLAPAWLDTLLLEKGLKPAAEFFARIQDTQKLSRAVLPVFFEQTEACLVTRQGLLTMAEMNPQVGRQLRVLAASPAVVPSAFCFPVSYTSPLKARIINELERIQTSEAGQQVLMIFQSERVEERPLSCFDSAIELLEKHRRLCGPIAVGAPDTPSPGSRTIEVNH